MPKQIQGLAQEEQLQDAFAFQGKLRLLLDEVVVPVAIVSDRSQRVLGRKASATLSVSGAVGFRSELELGLPVADQGQAGIEIFLEEIQILTTNAIRYDVGFSGGLSAPNVQGLKEWVEFPNEPAPSARPFALVQGRNNAVAAPGFRPVFRRQSEAGIVDVIPLGWILNASIDGIGIHPTSDDETLTANFVWRERPPR